MKKYISLFFAVSVALVACQKEQIADDARISSEKSGKTHVYKFIADSEDSKLTLGSYGNTSNTKALWEEGDAVDAYQVSDGENVGTATLVSDPGSQAGQFSLETTAEPGTEVRMIFPSADANVSYGAGTLPANQTTVLTENLKYSHAYSDVVALDESSQAKFALKHALATVLVRFKADPEGIFVKTSGNNYMNHIALRALDGTPLSGAYTVNYETGAVTPGAAAQVKNYVDCNRGGGFNSVNWNTAVFTAFPTGKEVVLEAMMTIRITGGDLYEVPVLFKGELKANQVNYFDLGLVSTKPEYLSVKKDYFAAWLAGEDIVVDTEDGHEMVINKTNYPTCTRKKASEITQYSAIWDSGLVFIDDCQGDIVLCANNSSEQKKFGTTNPVVIVGRFKDLGSQPVLQVHEIRGITNDLTFVNVGIKNMRTGGGAVFGAMSGTTKNFSLRVKDCRIDARNAQNVVDLQPNNTSTATKRIGYCMFDNCIVDMPRRKYDSDNGTDVKLLFMSFFASSKGTFADDSKNIVKNSIIYASEKVLYSETKSGSVYKGNGRVYLTYLVGKSLPKTSFIFKNNTIANFGHTYGICHFGSTSGSNPFGQFTFDDNLCFMENATVEEGATACIMTRNVNVTWTNPAHILGNVGAVAEWPTSYRSYKVFHPTYPFAVVEGSCEEVGYTYIVDSSNKYPFTQKDYTTGLMTIDTSIAKLKNAGARTPKKYVTAAVAE